MRNGLRQPTIRASGSVSVKSCRSFPLAGLKSCRHCRGIGLRSARRSQPAAHWASWADALKMVKERHPVVGDTILEALESGAETSSIQAILKCSQILHDAGFESPAWGELAEGRTLEEEDPCQPRFGWQQKASSAIEKHHFKVSVWPQLLEHERAMMRSQSGPLASTPFVSFPVDWTSRIDAGPFRALLLRRLRLSLPLSVRSCRCGQRVCWGAEVGRWSQSQHGCAEKEVPEFGRMCSCVTAGVSRLWRTVSLSFVVSSLP